MPVCLTSVLSLTQKCGPPSGLHTPSAGRDKLMPASKMRRLSALPTPSARRVSSVPIQTPKSCAKPAPSRKAYIKRWVPASQNKGHQHQQHHYTALIVLGGLNCNNSDLFLSFLDKIMHDFLVYEIKFASTVYLTFFFFSFAFCSPSYVEEVQVEPKEAREAETRSCPVEPASVDRSEPCSLVFSLETEAESETSPPAAPAAPEPVSKPAEPLLVNIEPQSVPEVKKTKDQTQLDLTKDQKMTEVPFHTSSLSLFYPEVISMPCNDTSVWNGFCYATPWSIDV